jgi:ribonuclease D
VDDLEALAASGVESQSVLTGWRGEIFGDLARDAIAGRVAVALERGEPTIITLDSDEEVPSRRRQALVA